MPTTSYRADAGVAAQRTEPATLDERLTVLAREGYRATPQRRAILGSMLNAGRENVTAEEICRRARTVCPTVNLATTYRTLDLFGRLGMVRRLTYGDGRSVFCPNVHPHYHGTCLRCGAVVDIPRGRVTKTLEQEQSKLTDGMFVVVGHRIEFYGYCASCRNAASRAGR
ncbi:MAG TPA: Fur family transcriptional regulator [bacterium]|nr:Fur family transcriptional regulator [bacterium]